MPIFQVASRIYLVLVDYWNYPIIQLTRLHFSRLNSLKNKQELKYSILAIVFVLVKSMLWFVSFTCCANEDGLKPWVAACFCSSNLTYLTVYLKYLPQKLLYTLLFQWYSIAGTSALFLG